jgi:soluble calcium-activated nucleotidase 1
MSWDLPSCSQLIIHAFSIIVSCLIFHLYNQRSVTSFSSTSSLPTSLPTSSITKQIHSEPIYYPAPTKNQMLVNADRLLFNLPQLEFAIVTDLDTKSRDPRKFSWRSVYKRGKLVRKENDQFDIEFSNETILESKTSYRNRSMELSELVRYDHLLLAMCDITGLVFKIKQTDENKPQVFQRWALADGDGEKAKPFKGEWATVKDGMLYMGSTGKEWTSVGIEEESIIIHRNPEWVKLINKNGRINNIDWGPVYQSIRTATNTSWPGYLWHEAVHFDQLTRRWIFLPRKASTTRYHPDEDEYKGTNLLITTAEDFSDITIRTLGSVEKEYGFSSVRKIPGTKDLFVA